MSNDAKYDVIIIHNTLTLLVVYVGSQPVWNAAPWNGNLLRAQGYDTYTSGTFVGFVLKVSPDNVLAT